LTRETVRGETDEGVEEKQGASGKKKSVLFDSLTYIRQWRIYYGVWNSLKPRRLHVCCLIFCRTGDYAELQNELAESPERGEIVKRGGGIRKLRFALRGRGKRGGVRVIHYWIREAHQIYMLLIYPKSKKDELTDRETALLREFVKEL
jgi:hypothetical protein